MPGTVDGGRKAAASNKAREPGFYSRIGKIGGQRGHTGGFAANHELARIAGARGGRVSRRLPNLPKDLFLKAWYDDTKTIDDIAAQFYTTVKHVYSQRAKYEAMGYKLPEKRRG